MSWSSTDTGTGLLMVRVIVLPENEMEPAVIELQPVTPVGILVGVRVSVGEGVMVEVGVIVGVSVLVGVLDGVSEIASVGEGVNVGVSVGVSVAVSVGVLLGVGGVGELTGTFVGGSVTTMDTARRIVRALSPRIGSLLATERSIKGTSLGTIGKKSPRIVTTIRVVFSEDGATPVSTDPSHISLQGGTVGGSVEGFVPAVPGPSS